MSLWCRKLRPLKTTARLIMLSGGVLGVTGQVGAAETYVQPRMELRAENNDNFDLVPGGSSDSDVYGFIADLQALFGIVTPRGETSIRPRLKLQEYPDREDLENFAGFLDLKSVYRWERSEGLLRAKYSYQDSYFADLPSGAFDPLDPDYEANPESDQLTIGETTTLLSFRPSFTHDLTQRTRLGVDGEFKTVRYDVDEGEAQTDYDYLIGRGFVMWTLDPRSDVSLGAYASSYEARDDSTETEAYGGEVAYRFRWSETNGIEANLFYEQNDTTDFLPLPGEESSSGWGGTLTAYYEGEISDFRATVGRTFIPTGSGSKAEADQIRMQFDRKLTQRLELTSSAILESRSSLTERGSDSDRDYARLDLALQWFVNRTWYVAGGYSYIWLDRESDDGDAYNNLLFASFGYKGLGPQGR